MSENVTYWVDEILKAKSERDQLRAILTELRAELDNYSDTLDDPQGPRPNLAMRLLQFLDEKLACVPKA
jgi:uncharacterized coiled-coil DUF342 family protein